MRLCSRTLVAVFSVVFGGAMGCGPSSSGGNGGGGGGGLDANMGRATGAVRGQVFAPGNGPGMVPSGHEIPVSGALVYLSTTAPAPIPQQVYCEECETPTSLFTYTDAHGSFTLGQLYAGDYYLVIQKGQFRRDLRVVVSEDMISDLQTEATTLPSEMNPSAGEWIPKIALAAGLFDDIETVLGKMGLGEVDSDGGFLSGTQNGFFDVYSNGGGLDGIAQGTLTDLVGDLNRMLDYHVIFIPCSGSSNEDALNDQQNLQNIRDYVNAGGKLYVSDWSGEWVDNVFPAQLQLGAEDDTPASAYDATTDTWDISLFGDANGGLYDSLHAQAVDPDLDAWMQGQSGPYPSSGAEGPYNPSDFEIHDNWNVIEATNSVTVGTDSNGNAVVDVPKVYVIGDQDGELPKLPTTVTYEPTGCGRVMYTTYHTTPNTHPGLVPQERILLYLIMEIGECVEGPAIE